MSLQECGHRFIENTEGSRPKRIVGGRTASKNSWPWIVSFVNKEDDSAQYCSGSLIDPHWILTTAHCFLAANYEFPAGKWKYIAGNHFLDEKDPHEQILEPEEVYVHPKYIPSNNYSPGDYDVALVRLRFPAKITRQVRPVCLPNDTRADAEEHSRFVVVGWGNVYDTPKYNRSRVLKELRVDIIPLDVCNGSSSYGGNVTRRQFCAGHPGGGQDACFGDSGGPLQYLNGDGTWSLKGLVSWGRGCARNHMYGLYTDVRALLPYIIKTMQDTKCGIRYNAKKNHARPKRIVGGNEAGLHSWPWIANLVDKKNRKQYCGGSIIASNWILTAAHCFSKGQSFDVNQHEYYVGDHTLDEIEVGEQKVIPEAIYVHPDYVAPTFSHPGNFDICLVKLKYSIALSDKIAPICLPDDSSVPPLRGLQCYVTGWGNVADTQEYKRSRVLKEMRVEEVSRKDCNCNVSYAGKVPENFFCAGFQEGGNDTCYGDSGGALQCDHGDGIWNVRGIVSWGIGCARPNYFGVYSNVSRLMPFVKAVLSGVYKANNDTLVKIGAQLNMTTEEIALLLRMTTTSLLLTSAINPDTLRQDIRESKVIEERVSRMEHFVLKLTEFQPGCEVDVLKLRKVLRNLSYEVAKNMSDDAVKKIILINHIGVFVEHVQLKNLGLFFGQSLKSLRELRLREVIVGLLGIPLAILKKSYSAFYDGVYVEKTLSAVGTFWNISTLELTLEKLLTASRLMVDEFDCKLCHENSSHYVPNCEVVCINGRRCPTEKCNTNNIIQSTKDPRSISVSKIKLALILGVFSGCLVAFIIVLLSCFISKHHRSKNARGNKKEITDENMRKSSESLPSKDASNNNLPFLVRSKAMNGKSSSYVALECFDQDDKCNGNLETIL